MSLLFDAGHVRQESALRNSRNRLDASADLPAVLDDGGRELVHEPLSTEALAHDQAGDRPDTSRSGSILIQDFCRAQILG